MPFRCLPVRARIALAIVALPAAVNLAAAQTQPRTQVMAALEEAVRLLEAKQHIEFVKTFVRPSELEELVAKFGTVDAAAAEFGKGDRPAVLLDRLRAAVKLEPNFRRDDTIAVFSFDRPIGRERSLTMQRIGERWYLRD
jgi:hypothetical protein